MKLSEAEKERLAAAASDCSLFGVTFMREGQVIPAKDVYKMPELVWPYTLTPAPVKALEEE